ncbi:hypothetical protein OJAV_G00139290 [Oryzias javanicus]|uniref:Uncharacterized protein n=1 Tax=Oryzias javanicus TaxID=123683 RepID=A0A437CMT6_ORYJA|nr:hypothetical protein OJAV_G00139290 [Oryzias javanicus]
MGREGEGVVREKQDETRQGRAQLKRGGGSWMKAAGTEESRATDMENRLMQTGPLLHHRGQRVELQG